MPTLDWLNRADAFITAARVPYRLLEQVSTHAAAPSAKPVQIKLAEVEAKLTDSPTASHDNLLIQGARNSWTIIGKSNTGSATWTQPPADSA